jgi:nucleoside-diphosphate-sugar epimerase
MVMKIFLTGASGYVGSHVATLLTKAGHELSALVSDSNTKLSPGISPVVGSLSNPDELVKLVEPFDAVGHFAAASSAEFAQINSRAIEALMGSMRRDQSFVMQGGSMVFGDTRHEVLDEQSAQQTPPFLHSQAALENSVLQAGVDGPRTFIVYGSLVHGGQGAMIPATLARAAKAQSRLFIPGDGTARWSTVHVEDWTTLIAAALERGPRGGHAYLASGPSVEIRVLLDMASDAWGLLPPLKGSDEEVQRAYGFFAPSLSMSQQFSAGKANRDFGWAPKLNDIAASLKEITP